VATSEPSTPDGQWQLSGVPVIADFSSIYELVAQPPSAPLQPGSFLPSPPFTPLPTATYFPTHNLKTIVPFQTYCLNSTVMAVGSAGALQAVARYRTSHGVATTVADLLNPAKIGGVLLVWAHAPSFILDVFIFPGGGVQMAADHGTLYPLDFSPPPPYGPTGVPDQSAMGYYVLSSGNTSPIGYFALVLPKGSSPNVTVTLTDPVDAPDQGRPWMYPPLDAFVQPGVSVVRQFPPGNFGPPDPTADPTPQDPPFRVCYPPP
jgi:hypothetical protein